MRLEGKVAIITGGASGMGAEECRIFAREGAKVVIADVSEDLGRQVEAEIAESGGDAVFMHLDVTSEDAWDATVNATVERYGKVDILVNNAGISGTHHPDTMSTEAWDTFMDINAKGVFLGMKSVIPQMQAVGGGSIVNISSISGIVGNVGNHMGYNASKGRGAHSNEVGGGAVRAGWDTGEFGASGSDAADALVERGTESGVTESVDGPGADGTARSNGRGRECGAVPCIGRGVVHYGRGTCGGRGIDRDIGAARFAAGVAVC